MTHPRREEEQRIQDGRPRDDAMMLCVCCGRHNMSDHEHPCDVPIQQEGPRLHCLCLQHSRHLRLSEVRWARLLALEAEPARESGWVSGVVGS